ncbi:MAG: type III-A CRISPR-associated RAMP protein Csm3 [Rhodocyclaceae bacterium]|nr:type III-A CRISPR-associated RAMP protein Csm3 [Rhodocyclaceae bacterium]
MQLTRIQKITGKIVLKTGLHIGAGDTEMRIGGTDNPVVKDPLTGLPTIPGSSLKGKIRSLLEWRHGLLTFNGAPYSFKHLAKDEGNAKGRELIKLFGGAPENDDKVKQLAAELGPTRVAFWDCPLDGEWKKTVADARNVLVTEAKSENSINRIAGVADNPRFTERVIAGAQFDFTVTLKVIDGEDLLPLLLEGLALLERDSLGGSGSRGYGKIEFRDLARDGQPLTLPADPFAATA